MRIRWREFELPSGVVHDKGTATETFGKFSIEPFEGGFGHTIGNGLRRVLLGAIEGAAVTSVEIEGIEHEFTATPGVVEDVTDLVMAFKALRVQVEVDAPVILTLDVSGAGEYTAKDIQCPTGVTIMNPELPLATLTEDRPLKATLVVRRGRGYVAADETGEPMDQIGLIPLDATYSPVLRCRYSVEATRVGKFTNYDRLVLEIWTDGTVSPEMALVEAAKIYRKHLNPFIQFSQALAGVPVVEEVKAIDAAAERRKDRMTTLLSESVDRLSLSTRARNCLDGAQIGTLGELLSFSNDELLKIKNLGQTVLSEIEKKLAELDLAIGMNLEEVTQA